MPKKTEPKSDLQRALFERFERENELRVVTKRIARAIDGYAPVDQEECLETVLRAVRKACGEPETQPLTP